MPRPLTESRYSVLSIDPIDNTVPTPNSFPVQDTPPTTPPSPKQLKRPRWEQRLPSMFKISSVEPLRLLHLPIELETTDTMERKAVQALLDSGATGCFIDRDFVQRNGLNTRPLLQPIPVFNVDGTKNEAGSITEILDIILRYKSHSECTALAVTSLGRQDLLLGFPWLKEHNPEVDWQTGDVQMTR